MRYRQFFNSLMRASFSKRTPIRLQHSRSYEIPPEKYSHYEIIAKQYDPISAEAQKVINDSEGKIKKLTGKIDEGKNVLSDFTRYGIEKLLYLLAIEFLITTLADAAAQYETNKKHNEVLRVLLNSLRQTNAIQTEGLDFDKYLTFFDERYSLNRIYHAIYRTSFLSIGYFLKTFFHFAPAAVFADSYIATVLVLQNDVRLAEIIADEALGENIESCEAYLVKALVNFKKGNLVSCKEALDKCKRYLKQKKPYAYYNLFTNEVLIGELIEELEKIIATPSNIKHQYSSLPKLVGQSSVPTTPYEYAQIAYQQVGDEPKKLYKLSYDENRHELIVCFLTNPCHQPGVEDKKIIEEDLISDIRTHRHREQAIYLTVLGAQSAASLADYAFRIISTKEELQSMGVRYIGFDSPGNIGFLHDQESLVAAESTQNNRPFSRINYFGYPDKQNTSQPHAEDVLNLQIDLPPNESSHSSLSKFCNYSYTFNFDSVLHRARFMPATIPVGFVQAFLLYYGLSWEAIDFRVSLPTAVVYSGLSALLWAANYGFNAILNTLGCVQPTICACSQCSHVDIFGETEASINTEKLSRYFNAETGQLSLSNQLPLRIIKWPSSKKAYGNFLYSIMSQPELYQPAFVSDASFTARLLGVYQFQSYQNTLPLSYFNAAQQRYLFDYLRSHGKNDEAAISGLLQFSLKDDVITVHSNITPDYFFRYVEYRTNQVKPEDLFPRAEHFNQRCAFFKAKLLGNGQPIERPGVGTVLPSEVRSKMLVQ